VVRFKKKNLVHWVVFVLLLVFLAASAPFFKIPAINILKFPLQFITLLQKEVKGIVFYRRNFTQNEKLKKEVDLLRQRLNDLEETKLQSQRLNRLLDLKQKSAYKVSIAQVIGRSADNWSSMVIINKGGSSGIKRGFVAIGYAGLLGRVIETTSITAKVMLINDSNSSVSALIQRSRQEGLVSGTIGNSLIMRYLPRDCDIKISDQVITSGLTQNYPKGFLIGEVTSVGDEFSGLSRYAVIKPAASLSKIEEVLIIVP